VIIHRPRLRLELSIGDNVGDDRPCASETVVPTALKCADAKTSKDETGGDFSPTISVRRKTSARVKRLWLGEFGVSWRGELIASCALCDLFTRASGTPPY